MVHARVVLRVFVAAAFIGSDVNEHRLVDRLRRVQNGDQLLQIVPVERPIVAEAHILKNRRVENILFNDIFHAPDTGRHGFTDFRHAAERRLHAVFRTEIARLCAHIREIARHRADIFGNRHRVIVQNHNQIPVQPAGIVEALVGEATGQRAVADHRDHMPRLAGEGFRNRKPERRRNRRAAVPRRKRVARTFRAGRKA